MLSQTPTIHPEHTQKITTTAQVFTTGAAKLEPGEYWIGPLEASFPPADNPTSPVSLVLDTLDGIDASEYDGVILTHGDTKVSFLAAPVEYPSIVEVKSLNAVAVTATPKKFLVNSYIVAIPKSDLLAYSNNYCDPNERVLVTVHEPLMPVVGLGHIDLLRENEEGTETVFRVVSDHGAKEDSLVLSISGPEAASFYHFISQGDGEFTHTIQIVGGKRSFVTIRSNYGHYYHSFTIGKNLHVTTYRADHADFFNGTLALIEGEDFSTFEYDQDSEILEIYK